MTKFERTLEEYLVELCLGASWES